MNFLVKLFYRIDIFLIRLFGKTPSRSKIIKAYGNDRLVKKIPPADLTGFPTVINSTNSIDITSIIEPRRIENSRKPVDREFQKVTKRVRTVVCQVDPSKRFFYNDKIKDGRSLKWYGRELATKLRKSQKFDRLTQDLKKEGYNISIKTTKGFQNHFGATRVHIRRREQ